MPRFGAGTPLVLAHRGAREEVAENTLAAFRRALALGADGVELDVRRSADGVLIVHHDAEHPVLGLLAEQPFTAIRAAQPEVPTLDEALDVLAGAVVNIEVKCLPWEPDADPGGWVGRAVADLVAARGIEDHVVVSSFALEALDAVHAYAPETPTGWLTMGVGVSDALALLAGRGHRYLHPDRAAALEAGAAGVERCRTAGLGVNVWTVNDPEEIAALARAGVDAVITDVPGVARAALRPATG
jgi:glycerophosphoryl diester phosphodiesterase